MHWTSINEKEIIKEWANEQFKESLSDKYLSHINKEKDSYWCKYDEIDDIKEYDFENIPELKEMLKIELKEDFYTELLLPLSVAAFKEKKIFVESDKKMSDVEEKDDAGKEENKDCDFKIPEFVYMF